MAFSWFGEAQDRHKNRFPRACASMSFLHVLGHRFLVFSRTLRNLKIMLPSRRNAYFRKIPICKHISNKCRFGLPFRRKKQGTTMKMSLQKRIFLEHNILRVCFRTFAILARFWDGPGAPKIMKKFVKSNPGGVKSGPGGSLGPLCDMAMTFEAIWKHVLMICHGFWKEI